MHVEIDPVPGAALARPLEDGLPALRPERQPCGSEPQPGRLGTLRAVEEEPAAVLGGRGRPSPPRPACLHAAPPVGLGQHGPPSAAVAAVLACSCDRRRALDPPVGPDPTQHPGRDAQVPAALALGHRLRHGDAARAALLVRPRQLGDDEAGRLREPGPGRHAQLGEGGVALPVPHPRRGVRRSLRQSPAQPDVAEGAVVRQGHEAHRRPRRERLAGPVDFDPQRLVGQHEGPAVGERQLGDQALPECPAVELVQRRHRTVPRRLAHRGDRVDDPPDPVEGDDVVLRCVPKPLAPPQLQEARPGDHVERIGPPRRPRVHTEARQLAEEPVQLPAVSAVGVEDEGHTVGDSLVVEHDEQSPSRLTDEHAPVGEAEFHACNLCGTCDSLPRCGPVRHAATRSATAPQPRAPANLSQPMTEGSST